MFVARSCFLPQVPASVALPFGTFERVIAEPENAAAAKELAALTQRLAGASEDSGVPAELEAIRALVHEKLKVGGE